MQNAYIKRKSAFLYINPEISVMKHEGIRWRAYIHTYTYTLIECHLNLQFIKDLPNNYFSIILK